ncbi:MAG: PmeII family type II restriction endonuclease [Caldilineaceae bacterium]
MNALDLDLVNSYVNENIVDFHSRKIKSLEELRLERLLLKNPYLFKAKHIVTAAELISNLLDAFLSSSEEKLFGDFLEGLAIFIAEQTCDGHKSSAPGVDLEFFNRNVHYVMSIKSGANWGNSSQHRRLEQDLRDAATRLKQSRRVTNVQPVLGICYGKSRTSYVRGYLKVVGQNFWYLISENRNLYTDIIEPIGFHAEEHNGSFKEQKGRIINLFSAQFVLRFCDSDGTINWTRLVEFNSQNFDLDKFLPE